MCIPSGRFIFLAVRIAHLNADMRERCRDAIMIPTQISLNLAACVNVVLYDRAAKRNEWPSRLAATRTRGTP